MHRTAKSILVAFLLAGVDLMFVNCGTNRGTSSIGSESPAPLAKREPFQFNRQWRVALETLPTVLTNSSTILSAPSPRVSTLIFRETGDNVLYEAKEMRLVSSRGGLVLVHISELKGCLKSSCLAVGLHSQTERDEVQIFNGLIATASYAQEDVFVVDRYGWGPGDHIRLAEEKVVRVDTVTGPHGTLYPLHTGQRLALKYTTSQTSRANSQILASDGSTHRDGQVRPWKPAGEYDVAITVSQDGQDPNIPIRLPGLDGPFSTLRIEEQFLAARTRIELPEPERKSCTALFSAKLNWIVNMTCGKFSTDLVGYTADGISHGITYLEAAGELQQLYVRDRVARQAKLAALKRESAQLISQREAELAQQRAEAEAQSRDLVQNLLRTAAIAAGTAVQGLQQSQAVKQGIPPTVNIVPEQGIGEAGMDGDPYGGMVVGGETYDAGAGLGNLRDVGLDGGTAYGGVPTAEGVNSGEILRAGSACPVNMMHLIPRMRSKLTFWGPSIWGPDRTCQACDKGFSSDIPAQIKQWGTEGLLSGLKWQNESEKDPEWIMVRGEAAKAVRCWQQTGAHPATASTEAPDGEKAQFDRERDRMLERMESQRPAVKPSAPSRPPIPNYEERPPCSRQPCTTK